MDYLKRVSDFMSFTGSEMSIEFLKNDFHFPSDNVKRDIYKITLKRGSREFSFNFGQSYQKSGTGEAPSEYDVLACLQAYEPTDDIDDFASEFGYIKPSEAITAFEAVKNEYNNLKMLYSDKELEMLQNIN